MKDAADCVDEYWWRLFGLSYPQRLPSVGLLESESRDHNVAALQRWLPRAEAARPSTATAGALVGGCTWTICARRVLLV